MTSDDQTDSYDPQIAERFTLFERLVPPSEPTASFDGAAPDAPLTLVGQADDQPAELVDNDRWPSRRHRPAMIAVAAAAAIIAGVSVVAFTGGGAGPELVEAGPADDDGLVVSTTELSESSAADAAADADPAEGGDASGDAEQITIEVPSDGSGAGDGVTPTTGTTLPPTSATSETTAPASTETTADDGTGDTTGSAPPKQTTVPEGPTGSVIDPSKSGEVVTIAGIVAEVFQDCQSWLVLNENGEAEHRTDISCDGGSFIMVEGQRIQTTSGYVAAADAFDKHPSGVEPGDFVVVTAINGPYGGLSLDCGSCGVKR